MKFSIRERLGSTFLVVLALLAGQSSTDAQRDRRRIASLEAEIKSLRAQTYESQPALHQAYLHSLEEYDLLEQLRERAVEHFARWKKKYGAIREPDPGVLGIRRIPVLQAKRGRPAQPRGHACQYVDSFGPR